MFNKNSPAFLYDPVLAGRVLRLIFGRLIFMSVIAFGGWWWVPGGYEFSWNIVPGGSRLFLPVTIALTAVYLIWLRFGRTLLWQVRLQESELGPKLARISDVGYMGSFLADVADACRSHGVQFRGEGRYRKTVAARIA